MTFKVSAGRIIAVLTSCVLLAIQLQMLLPSADESDIRSFPKKHQMERLVLVEETAYELPADFDLTGAIVVPQGGLLFWSDELVMRSADLHTEAEPVCFGRSKRTLAAAIDSQGIVYLLSGADNYIRRWAPAMSCTDLIRLAEDLSLEAAAWTDSNWIVGGISESGTATVRLLKADGATIWQRESDGSLLSLYDPRTAHLSGASGFATLSLLRAPYTTLTMTTGGHERRDELASGTILDHEGVVSWFAMPRFPLDRGYLQVFADPYSDARALLLSDERAKPLRLSTLSGRWGIVQTIPTQQRLLALRVTDIAELVVYRWSWGAQ